MGIQHKFHYATNWGRMMLSFRGRNIQVEPALYLVLLLWKILYCKFIANHFRAFDVLAALLMELLLHPHFLNCIGVFPLWLGMKSITHPPTAQLDKWPPLAVSLCGQMFSLSSLSNSHLLSLAFNRRMQKGRTELCLTYQSSQRSFSTTAKVKSMSTAICLVEEYFVVGALWLF